MVPSPSSRKRSIARTTSIRLSFRELAVAGLLAMTATGGADGQTCTGLIGQCTTSTLAGLGFETADCGDLTLPLTQCLPPPTAVYCQQTTFGNPRYDQLPLLSGGTQIIAAVPFQALGQSGTTALFGPLWVGRWYNAPQPPSGCGGACSGAVSTCGSLGAGIDYDRGELTLSVEASCSDIPVLPNGGQFSVRATRCQGVSCETNADSQTVDLSPGHLRALLGCPPVDSCVRSSSASSGASAASCPLCKPAGPCSVGADGSLSCWPPKDGPQAYLRYRSGGVGGKNGAGVDYPGAAAWRSHLGRYWSHDYAKRVVVDPNSTHVWLLTEDAVFIEYSGLGVGATGVYPTVAPSDEFRTLTYTGSGWEFRSLDGRTDHFDSTGRWTQTVLAQDPSHPTTASYNGSGQLQSVALPDGRSETYTYHGSGKLQTISEVPVAGSGGSSRSWSYTWSGDELTEILRPDGSRWEMTYDSTRPGYISRVRLVTSTNVGTVAAAFEYLTGTNAVAKSWRGDILFTDPNATNKTTYSYTFSDSSLTVVSQSIASEVVTPTFSSARTVTLGRDSKSTKAKPITVTGDCPSCGLTPTSTYAYAGANELLPSSLTDAKGTRTDFTYTASGRVASKTEAANVSALTRATSFGYNSTYPGLITTITQPSTSGSGNRTTTTGYDSAGRVTSRTSAGIESGSSFSLQTTFTPNSSGETVTIDPPGFTTTDQTTFTFGLTGRNGHVADSRTDPLVGTTTFGYDGFNRRTAATDPNGVQMSTVYDALDRVVEKRHHGATTPADLVTLSVYDGFGDLYCTKLPRGNGVERLYDTSRRLTQVIRGTAVTTPAWGVSPTCLDGAQPRERTFYAYDGAGNRIEERRQSWSGSAWVDAAVTTFEYSCHLDKMTQGSGGTSSVTEYCYDLNKNLEKQWDANHPRASFPSTPTSTHSYDALNRLTAVSQPWSGGGSATTAYEYDVQDHLTKVTDAEANETTYVYSDRDLMTQQTSPVTGLTLYDYNDHGQLVQQDDDRAVSVVRQVDAADRLTLIDYSDPNLDTTFTYGSTPASFNVGRLTSISRPTSTVSYTYDRFGRLTQDGALAFQYDANGNRSGITYPGGGIQATYTFDAEDRHATLSVTDGGGSPQTVASAATYAPSGPLTGVTLGNALVETRGFDNRYFPTSISVPSRLGQTYTTDAVGNPTAIADSLVPARSRTFTYQDTQYFLTQGTGSWGTRTFTYDKIGNRLTDGSEPYSYQDNGTGNTPLLQKVGTSPHCSVSACLDYDEVGNQTHIGTTTAYTDMSFDEARNLADFSVKPKLLPLTYTTARYDGRGFLDLVDRAAATTSVTPVYSSEGVLYRRTRTLSASSEAATVLYFANRPIATISKLTTGSGTTTTWTYLTTDHLGTPTLASNSSGSGLWSDGFDPFGGDLSGAASSAGVFLRFPGQWTDPLYSVSTKDGLFYNLHRWYQPSLGRYESADPLGLGADLHPYRYARSNPATYFDRDGRQVIEAGAFSSQMVACAMIQQEFARSQRVALSSGEALNYRWTHCYASCQIQQVCGNGVPVLSQAIAFAAGLVKEFRDLWNCRFDRSGMGIGFGNYCESAFQWSDFEDNALGYGGGSGSSCRAMGYCEKACNSLKNAGPTEPGPFYLPRYLSRHD